VLGKNIHKGGHGVSEIVEEKLHEKIKKVRLLILDVDGVMTDGKIIIDDVGNEVKHFNGEEVKSSRASCKRSWHQ
jgi:hypothetical protein